MPSWRLELYRISGELLIKTVIVPFQYHNYDCQIIALIETVYNIMYSVKVGEH